MNILTYSEKGWMEKNMAMKEGDVARIEYTARDSQTQEVLDATQEPVTIILGDGELLPALNQGLQGMNVGEQKVIPVTPKNGFGDRDPELVRVVPLQEFRNRNISPFPGLVVELNESQGRVQSVSGGRVRVDFNHPLAGKTVEYDVTLLETLQEPEKKVSAIVKKFLKLEQKDSAKISGKKVEVHVTAKEYARSVHAQPLAAQAILKAVKEIEQVEFINTFTQEDFKPAKQK